MQVFIEKDYSAMSKKAAQIFANEIQQKPDLVLGLATGSTPIGTYQELIRMHKEEGLDFSKAVSFNLDEYYGLASDNPQSYNYFMFENLFNHVNIKKENVHIPNGLVSDVETYCKQYDEEIEKYGGIDLQLLGIGVNGHIGFNEPAEELVLGTHLTDLTEDTIKANSRFFDSPEEVPTKAITMGIGSIMKAKKILLLASGKNKAEIMAKLLNSDVVTTKVPASLLMLHPDVTIIMDEEAASLCKR
ncbi:glucosamine-6-phosphate deaminase [Tepidanaerobacter acetatoxydans Re1]|uniref:Glucosamine-6-phosphate deaminase n=1 Tax=Tepidanaerobacter acetatoxydans (strain DSM 21804 / JCM 16047 / Re1) TaxID=1209989 RepID=F4LUU7_TEPAE|nr:MULTISPECIES: glucosamine-6-phosphate deaminase [Tepidanaerobacter]AEE90665.1 Glucosamine-6-phosphate deaminase [Tepidanaerobacter acetatoxydans Re1]CDI40399.1 glucosamine-6-phosphate deaminase [Tepidanaerobacter acetatoxydans Re1]